MTEIAPLKFHGRETYLAPKIIELSPRHVHYDEPFFGGGAVLFPKPVQWIENHSQVINVIHGELVNFWRVLRSVSMFDELHSHLLLTPFGIDQWNEALHYAGRDPVEGAMAFAALVDLQKGEAIQVLRQAKTQCATSLIDQTRSSLCSMGERKRIGMPVKRTSPKLARLGLILLSGLDSTSKPRLEGEKARFQTVIQERNQIIINVEDRNKKIIENVVKEYAKVIQDSNKEIERRVKEETQRRFQQIDQNFTDQRRALKQAKG